MYGLALILVAAVLNGLASVLLKMGAGSLTTSGSLVDLVWGNRFLLGGLLLFALNVLVYYAALKVYPLSSAYPTMVALSFLVVIAGSVVFFKETISSVTIFGVACILVGVYAISSKVL